MISAISPYRPLLPQTQFGIGATQTALYFGKHPTPTTPPTNPTQAPTLERWKTPWTLTNPEKLLRNIHAWLGIEPKQDLDTLPWQEFSPHMPTLKSHLGRFIPFSTHKSDLLSIERTAWGPSGDRYLIRFIARQEKSGKTPLREEVLNEQGFVIYRRPYSRDERLKPIIPRFNWQGWNDLLHAEVSSAAPELSRIPNGRRSPKSPAPPQPQTGSRLKVAA